MKDFALNHGWVYIEGELKKRSVWIRGEKIHRISDHEFSFSASLDCKGLWVLPGAIDPHVHFRTPGEEYKENWQTASNAALSGGITSVLDMPNNQPPTITKKRLQEKRQTIQNLACVNFGLHLGADTTVDSLSEIKHLKEKIPSVKVYFARSTGNLLLNDPKVLRKLFLECPVPITLHAEHEATIQSNQERISQASEGSRIPKWQEIPQWHGKIRSSESAFLAVKEIAELAQNTSSTLYFCHISTPLELEWIETVIRKEHSSRSVYCEVTPHHLFLNESDGAKMGNYAKVNPPLRNEKERQELYQAFLQGRIDCMASDHAPHTKEEKEREYWNAPSGIPGLETMIPLLLTEVHRGNLPLSRLVQVTSQNAQKIFSIRNKAHIKPGYDADLFLVRPSQRYVLKQKHIYTQANWNPFLGKEFYGKIESVFLLGNLAYQKGEFFPVKGKEISFQS